VVVVVVVVADVWLVSSDAATRASDGFVCMPLNAVAHLPGTSRKENVFSK